MDLFNQIREPVQDLSGPLADRMRPDVLESLVGQEHITRKGTLLEQAITHDRVFSMILWGPPGCGKTTLAGIIARETKCDFVRISAVLSGVKDVRKIIEKAEENRRLFKRRTLLFVDEIHRFNKAQQDAFLFHVENGLITLVGATTENPSFEVIPALVSRCRVFSLKSLGAGDLVNILKRALVDPDRGLGRDEADVLPEALEHIARVSDGDARIALTNLETAAIHFSGKKEPITSADIESAVAKKSLLYDKAGEEHYNLISAFIKSLRGSDPDAAMYWLERMLSAGEDPCYMMRRMIRFATEDIGLADPGALTMALNAGESFRILGRPEGDGSLYQAAVYLATAPKSNAVYMAQHRVRETVDQTGYIPVPLHIRNAPTKLMKEMGYHEGYEYPHDFKDAVTSQSTLPDSLAGTRFYLPTDRGYEQTVRKRLEAWLRIRRQRQNPRPSGKKPSRD